MHELNFTIHHRVTEACPHMQQAFLIDISLGLGKWKIESGITLATLAEESCTDPGICSGTEIMTKPALPIQKPEIPHTHVV